MSEALSPADRSSLSAEQGPVSMAVGAALVFDGGPGVSVDAVEERLGARLHLIPRYRQRVEHLTPGGMTNPVWVDDTGFDVGWHLRHASVDGSPGLAELVGHELSRRLDRRRPLWEMTVATGLEHGRVALVPKMHHALVDGVAAVDVGTVILDPSPEPMDVTPEGPWEPKPYDRRRHLARLAATPMVRGQRLLLDSARRALDTSPRRAADDLLRATELLTELARSRPQAPMTALNEPLGPNRRFAMADARLDALKRAGKAHGGTVNDAILAAVTGMLAAVLPQPERRPVALVPVSVRQEGEQGGNRISTVFVDLPVELEDFAGRVEAIAVQTRELKGSAAVRAGALLQGAAGWAPPLVSSGLARAMSGVRAFNLVVSNVPGPQVPFFLNGSQLRAVHPAVPLNPANQRLSIGVLSYDGGVFFGLLADRDLDPPVTTLASALTASLAELAA